MNKLIAAAAISVAALMAPVAPAQADTAKDFFESCLVLPLLKDECAPTAPKASATAAKTAAVFEWPETPRSFTNCARAPEGSKVLFTCE